METLQLELSEFTRRAGSLLVAHSATSLGRGLEPGETLLVRDGERDIRFATVRDISFDLTDTQYRLELGAVLDAATAEALRRDTAAGTPARVDLPELLALLRAARTLASRPVAAER